jgi:filamentous hemagglutinin family protein
MMTKRLYFKTIQRFSTRVFLGVFVYLTNAQVEGRDILRPSSSSGGAVAPTGSNGAALTRAATDAARANTQDILRRTGQTLDAMRAMQAAARAAAGNGPNNLGPNLPDVPNGLRSGGLNPAADAATNPARWSGAGQPVETINGENVNVTIKQTTQQALLHWQTLNVGKKTTLNFDQSAGGENVGQWIAFNQVNDPTGNPTQILGNIKADGQVYLINRNGVIFGGSSQVNARGLTVSSLPINTNLVSQGLLNNPDAQFLFTGLDLPAGINGTKSFSPDRPLSSDGKYGDVVVQKGAIIESPTNAAKSGGRVTLVGPNVTNQGSILTPDGQTIIAAGLQVGFDAHASSDPSLRGLDVFVGAVTDPTAGLYTGTTLQDGVVEAARGSITIAGRDVQQNGGLVSTTSVSLNGRIDIQAQYNAVSNRETASSSGAFFLFADAGAISLGIGSVVSILPEYSSAETTIGTELSLRSHFNSVGKTIHMGAGSSVLAPNANVSLAAGTWLFEAGATPRSTFVQSGGQIYLDSGATINVAGSIEIPTPVTQNIVSVDLRSAELANSPLQRSGILRNATIQFDIRETGDGWIGTPLADVSGFANLIQRSVGQLTVAGGSVSITAGASVVMQQGSTVDVSGGSTFFQGGKIKTTQLITGGRLVDIAKATPDLVYDGIYDGTFIETNSKFQVTNVYNSPLARDGSRYVADSSQGAAGGKLVISAPSMALDGRLLGLLVTGEKQREAPPERAALTFSFFAQDTRYRNFPIYSPTPPTVVFDPNMVQGAVVPFQVDANGEPTSLTAERLQTVYLSPDLLSENGFGQLTVNNNDGEIIVPSSATVEAPGGGSITLAASNILVAGSIIAPGGNLLFRSYNLTLDAQNLPNTTTGNVLPVGDPNRGRFVLGATSMLSTAGLLVDNRSGSAGAGLLPLFSDGGTITLEAYSAELTQGGGLDVSGGAVVSPKGRITYGDAGTLSISAGRDLTTPAVLGGRLALGATLAGFSGAKAGSLSIEAPAIQIGGQASHAGVTLLASEFFNNGGFARFSLTGIGLASATQGQFITGLYVAPEARIHPVVPGLTAELVNGSFKLRVITKEEGVRDPSSISFSAQGALNPFESSLLGRGDVILAEGSSIVTDAKGAVSFTGDTVTLSGAVVTPGGLISAGGALRFPSNILDLLQPTTLIGKSALLSTAGKTVLLQNPLGIRKGQVVAGGSISLTGNIVAEHGALLDVSGASGVLDVLAASKSLTPAPVRSLTRNLYAPLEVHSDGGSIVLRGSRMLYSDAMLIGRAGGSSATGGSVTVSSGRFAAQGSPSNTAEINLVVRQDGSLVPGGFVALGPGITLTDSQGNALLGIGNFTVSTFSTGGFDSLNLNGNVEFEGNVAIATPGSVRISSGGIVAGSSNVRLASGYVNLGQAFSAPTLSSDNVILFTQSDASGSTSPYNFAPTYGIGTLTVEAGLIDIGNLSLQGIGKASFDSTQGDIRGNGTLSMAGALEFKAGQIYPTTAGQFGVFAYDFLSAGQVTAGSVSISGGASRQTPLSAGGKLGIYASRIDQGGTLRAPIGTIVLGWDGTGTAPVDPIAGSSLARPVTSLLTLGSHSFTSVSALDPASSGDTLIPYGISLDGNSWIDPSGVDITLGGVPGKSVNIGATKLVTEGGSAIDISGGGDLYAYRWIEGNGGSEDILGSSSSFAIIPGYGFDYSPYAPFNTSSATNLDGQTGYTNSSLKVGDQVTFAASGNLPAGTFTLLPARYALMPGALLVTPQSGSPTKTVKTADGATIIAGYRSNNLNVSRSGQTLITRFELATSEVVRARAEYQNFLANSFLREAAATREVAVSRLPVDAGYLAFSSTAAMSLRGSVFSLAPVSGRGSLIDINSSSDILINSSGVVGSAAGLVLSAQTLNSFGAESLLIGGRRSFGSQGTTLIANSANVTLDNAGAALTGKDIILVSRENLKLAENSEISALKDGVSLENLLVGDSASAGSGNGSLVRVSANATGQVSRFGVNSSILPELLVRSGVLLTGGSILLDSTAGTSLSQSSRLIANDVALNSGQISISLTNPGVLNPTTGLVLAGDAFSSLQNSAKRLSLLSYSTMDVYGTGSVGSPAFESLSLQASAIRGFNTSGGSATFTAASLSLGNGNGGSFSPAPLASPLEGSLAFEADRITVGSNAIRLDGYAQASLSASGGILITGQGSLDAAGNLDLITPLLTGAGASKYAIRSTGRLQLVRQTTVGSTVSGGFGADLTLQGASVRINGDITLPSGRLILRATMGNLTVGTSAAATLNLAGTATTFVDSIRYTDGGTISLFSDTGSVRIDPAAGINVSANAGGGDAGTIQVKAPGGLFDLVGAIAGAAGDNGEKGRFSMDVGSLTAGSLASLDAVLNAGSFTSSRDYRIRTGDVNVDGFATSHVYRVASDAGNIVVSGMVNASGITGGSIDLKATGSLTLVSGSSLNASGNDFDSAGKGGVVVLEAGNPRNGVSNSSSVLALQDGSTIDLSVAAADAASQSLGKFTGTLHLRAPRNAANTDLQVNAIGSSITDASIILVEGVKLYGLTGIGTITSTIQNLIRNDATAYLGAAGTTTAGYTAMLGRLSAPNPGLNLILAPGAEIYNLNGSLTLGASNSTASSDWNLSTFRFGPRSASGVLTLRASENLTLFNALSDGFSGGSSLWLSPLNPYNPLLPANAQSWSLRMAAGADLSAASFRDVRTLESLPNSAGFFELGKNAGAATATGGAIAQTSSVIGNFFQVIRTGSGNIDIHAGRDVRLLNLFASIYTAGTILANPTTVNAEGDFVVPILNRNVNQGNLGSAQQNYLAQFSMAGGNVTLSAGRNIERKTRNNSGLIDDSSRQLPDNWLYRRGYVDQSGNYGAIRIGSGIGVTSDPAASSTWWVDFSNFFQGVGALGGGNIDLTAGQDVMNVDAVIPTNARTARGTPAANGLVELGGGDLRVTSNRDISGGVYYVERGHGVINVGGSITTNATRSPSFGLVADLNNPKVAQFDSLTWMPTTLFVGKSSFNLTAAGNLLLGPVSNPFSLPQGIGNRFWYKTYFSTISPQSSVVALSLGGDVTYRNAVTLPSQNVATPMLEVWHQTQLLFTGSASSTSWFQPWLRLAETGLTPFSPVWSLSASNLSLTSLTGDLNLVGDLTTFPSPTGQLEFLAAGSINALQPTGLSRLPSRELVRNWFSSTINLSDANPGSIPRELTPLTSVTASPAGAVVSNSTVPGFMNNLSMLFEESGSVTGINSVLQTRQARHTQGGLRGNDAQPLRIYALGGDLSGLTLFSGKEVRISSARDISDVALYVQNNNAEDSSIITAGRDITVFDSASLLRVATLSSGNVLSSDQNTLPGDIQISGPGTLQVLAGRDLDLGTGSNQADGTGTGITSIGSRRNPYLTAAGADVVIGAGIGPAASLAMSDLDFGSFINEFVLSAEGKVYLEEIAPGIDFNSVSDEERAHLALEVFYLYLRNTGRNFNNPESPEYQSYTSGFAAIKALFPESASWAGQILTQSRDIRTRSGGNISIFTPGGGLTMANTTIGNQQTPPGIITESGGSISLFTDQSVDIGVARIFTLRGGDLVIWSSKGNIAAGSSSRTVQSAPPTRVVIDPQSASVETDRAGLATGGGIGVLATVEGVSPGDVDLIAPSGIIDAGEAGIRVTGNINLAAVSVLNAANISASGTTSGAPSTSVSAPSVSTITSAANTVAASTSTIAASEQRQTASEMKSVEETASIISVVVIGYGQASDDDEDEQREEPATDVPSAATP